MVGSPCVPGVAEEILAEAGGPQGAIHGNTGIIDPDPNVQQQGRFSSSVFMWLGLNNLVNSTWRPGLPDPTCVVVEDAN
ncbi:unnamed protein product, partial [Mesorhabditis belari]|uniref:Uncharacterized protein n=1 Tax=Mesorhabditis belari TaxID=2138241 RepID=A0AAF3FME6_9BILA